MTLDANMRVAPQLAERWETVDELTWRFFIRRGVVFQNGQILTADDVISSIQRTLNHPDSKISGHVLEVEKTRKVSDWEVEIINASALSYPPE